MVNIVQNFFIMLNTVLQMPLKLLPKRVVPKIAKATDNLIGNKTANKIKNFTTK